MCDIIQQADRKDFYRMFRAALGRTRQAVFGRIASVLGSSELTDDVWEELEALLVQADMGIHTSLAVTDRLRKRVKQEGLTRFDQVQTALKDILVDMLPVRGPDALSEFRLLTVVLVIGVNGSGKTTSIAKLASRWQEEGWRIMLSAADTFRAAAIEQLQTWGKRLDIPVISGQQGGDPGAVVYDSIRAARARDKNLLIIDTAGRLHTKYNLMEELKKIRTVISKNVHDAPHEVLLVVDGTTGQNALQQARYFKDAIGVTGVVLTKLDSTARGGMVFAIGNELGLPIRYIGEGEGLGDLSPFDPAAFVDALF
nr:signal recognition particle-docking protein FtsY [Anaerolineae bacterium]